MLTPQTSPAATLQIAADMTPFDAKADVYNGTTGDSDKQGAVKVFVIDLLKLGVRILLRILRSPRNRNIHSTSSTRAEADSVCSRTSRNLTNFFNSNRVHLRVELF